MTTILEVRKVKKSYCMGKVRVRALRGVSFDVEKGKFLSIFGSSGSGKSTLLHLMGGLIGIITGYGLSYALAYVLSSFTQPQQQNTPFPTPELRE